jgi:hypothetical protein
MSSSPTAPTPTPTQSQSPHIGLLVSGNEALADYNLFVSTLELWHPDAVLYVYTDSETNVTKTPKSGTLHVNKTALDKYKGKRRAEMEASPGTIYDSLFKEYTYEKANVMKWMFEMQSTLKHGVWFMDADILHCAPLPTIPESAIVALSPHYIRAADEMKFGNFNAGYMWFKEPALLEVWKTAGHTSRFFEQAALEQVALVANTAMYSFPPSVNFGWWRMFQSPFAPPDQQKKFSIYRPDTGIGIRYDGRTLQSIHTHWYQRDGSSTHAFNQWFIRMSQILKGHKPMQQFLRILNKEPCVT